MIVNYLDYKGYPMLPINEEYLSDEDKANIDSIIQILTTYKDADYKNLPGGHHAGSHYIQKVADAVDGLKRYGVTQDQKQAQESQKLKAQQNRKVEQDETKIVKKILRKLVTKYPLYVGLDKKQLYVKMPSNDDVNISISILLYDIRNKIKSDNLPVDIDQISKYTNNVFTNISTFLINTPAYQNLEEHSNKLKQLGFVYDDGQLECITRYAVISDVVFAGDYPILNLNAIVTSAPADYQTLITQHQSSASAVIRRRDSSPILITNQHTSSWDPSIELKGVTLEHIGEIIDTIDILVLALSNIKCRIYNINLYGNNAVEYVIEFNASRYDQGQEAYYLNRLKNRTLNINSEDVTSVQSIKKQIFELTKNTQSK